MRTVWLDAFAHRNTNVLRDRTCGQYKHEHERKESDHAVAIESSEHKIRTNPGVNQRNRAGTLDNRQGRMESRRYNRVGVGGEHSSRSIPRWEEGMLVGTSIVADKRKSI